MLAHCAYFTLHSVSISVCLMLRRTCDPSTPVAVIITPARLSVM